MDIRKYSLPLTCVTITGSKARMTPGLLARFSEELAKKSVNVEAVATGEYAISFYVEADRGPDAMAALQAAVVKRSAFNALSMRKDVGMISATGDEFINTPGMLTRLLQPLGDNLVDILAVSTSFDSVLIFVDMQCVERAFELLASSFEQERPLGTRKELPELEVPKEGRKEEVAPPPEKPQKGEKAIVPMKVRPEVIRRAKVKPRIVIVKAGKAKPEIRFKEEQAKPSVKKEKTAMKRGKGKAAKAKASAKEKKKTKRIKAPAKPKTKSRAKAKPKAPAKKKPKKGKKK